MCVGGRERLVALVFFFQFFFFLSLLASLTLRVVDAGFISRLDIVLESVPAVSVTPI